MDVTVREAAEAVGGTLLAGDPDTIIRQISLNSREIGAHTLFVPIIGEKVDAHRFLSGAFSEGAVCAFTSEHGTKSDLEHDAELRNIFSEGKPGDASGTKTGKAASLAHPALIAVRDTRTALQALGCWVREHKARIPFVGVTGSVGKTTTREMIACALSSEKRVYATKGNSNSQVGVPITVAETDPEAEIGVIELGMSEFGEMHRIAEVARVNAAVMTNIGISHINQLKTQENILKEKLHILDGTPDGTPLFLNGDDPLLCTLSEEKIHAYGIAEGHHIPLVFYGTGENADWRAEDISLSDGIPRFRLRIPESRDRKEQEITCCLQVAGMHMVLNAAAAIAVSDYFGVNPLPAAKALSAFSGVDGRGEIMEIGGVRIIDDSYNAAPASMKAGLSVLCDLPAAGRRIAVLADMLELGEQEKAYHREVGSYIRENKLRLDEVLLYGPLSAYIAEGIAGTGAESASEKTAQAGGEILRKNPDVRHFEDLDALSETLVSELRPGDSILIKGSNAMGLRKVIERLRENSR